MRGSIAVRLRRALAACGGIGVLVGLGLGLLSGGGGFFAGAGVALAAEAPLGLSAPTIAGTAADGQRLKAAKGTWSGQRPIAYAYRWSRCDAAGEGCVSIPTSARPTLRVAHEDVGHTLRVTVTAVDAGGEASATSAPSAVIAPSALRKGKAPRIAGSPHDGQLLTVDHGTWKGTPPDSFAYEWEACPRSGACTPIPGADAASYRVQSAQIAETLRVIVTAGNPVGELSLPSRRSAKIAAGVPVNVAAPSVTGTPQEAQTLTADPGSWAGTGPISFTYQWLRCSIAGGGCEEIAGATEPTYDASGLDLASNLAVRVTAGNALGSVSADSSETQPILGILPTNTVLPTISGLLQDGGLLSGSSGSWSGTAPISFTYAWELCDAAGQNCKDLEQAVGQTLSLASTQVGSTLRLAVSASNVAGEETAVSSPTGLVAALAPSNLSPPTISGLLQSGQLLSVATGSWAGTAPISYTYQWQLCNALGGACTNLAKATEPGFKLSLADIGLTLRAIVTATNAGGAVSQPSAVTGLILGLL
jgi:hypothetical protein